MLRPLEFRVGGRNEQAQGWRQADKQQMNEKVERKEKKKKKEGRKYSDVMINDKRTKAIIILHYNKHSIIPMRTDLSFFLSF